MNVVYGYSGFAKQSSVTIVLFLASTKTLAYAIMASFPHLWLNYMELNNPTTEDLRTSTDKISKRHHV